MSPYSITRENAERDLGALRHVLRSFDNPAGPVFDRLREIADSIEEQVEKIDPVEALVQEYARRDWDAASADEDSTTWRYFITPSRLREFAAEVLRIGVGEATANHDVEPLGDVRVGQYVRIKGHGLWRLISVNTEPGSIGVAKVDGP